MPLPLYQGHGEPAFGPTSHAGLMWNKFFNQWDASFVNIPERGKRKWLEKFERKTGDQADLDNMITRQQNLLEALGGRGEKYVLQAPFVIGMGYEHPVENGMAWHPTLGVPYLPGSSIKGLVRAWAQDWMASDMEEIDRIFGGMKTGAGRVIFLDALPLQPVEMQAEIMTPHDGGWRIKNDDKVTPADWVSPVPIPFLAVAPNNKFFFAIAPRHKNVRDEDLTKAMEWLPEALDWLGAGAKTSLGYGRFIPEKDSPLKEGDRVVLLEGYSRAADIGEEGTITRIYDNNRVEVNLDRTGRKSKPIVTTDLIKRI